jgi:hypothetical protein
VHGQWRFAVVIVAALLVVVAVWTWLPPTEDTQGAIERALVAYESQHSVVWPQEHLGDASLSETQLQALLDDRAAAWRAVADDEALLEILREDADSVRHVMNELQRRPQDGFIVAAGGDVPLFDFRRRTFRGEVLVRAAVARWVETGRWDAQRGELEAVQRRSTDGAMIKDYTLRQVGESWRVVAAAQVDEAPFFYYPATGETGTGP